MTDAADERGIIRKESAQKRGEYILKRRDEARAYYMAWIYKMIQKIGNPVVKADMTGDPWIRSTIVVFCQNGMKQVWTTTMIINRSKYDNLFNQFPSRRVEFKKVNLVNI